MNRKSLTLNRLIDCFLVFSVSILAAAQPATGHGDASPLSPKRCWTYTLPDSDFHDLSADETRIFVSRDDARIETILSASGDRSWTAELGGEIVSNILIGKDNVYVATRSEKAAEQAKVFIRGLTKSTGITVWKVEANDTRRLTLGFAGQMIIAASDAGALTAIDPVNGGLAWNFRADAALSSEPWFGHDNVVITTTNNQILRISASAGVVSQRFSTRFRPTAVSLDDSDALVWGDERGNLNSSINPNGQPLWKLKQGAQVSTILPGGDDIIVSSRDNFIYAVTPGSGHVRWKQRQSGRALDVQFLGTKYLIVFDASDHKASILDLKNGTPVHQFNSTDEDDFIHSPAVSGNIVVFASSGSLSAFNIGGCREK